MARADSADSTGGMQRSHFISALAVGIGVTMLGGGVSHAALSNVTYSGARAAGSTITVSGTCTSTDTQGTPSAGILSGTWGLDVETAPGSNSFVNLVTAGNFALDANGSLIGSFVIPADAATDRLLRIGGGECEYSSFGDGSQFAALPLETFTLTAAATTTAPSTVAPTTIAPTTTAPGTAAPTSVIPTTAAAAAAATTAAPQSNLPTTGPVTGGLPAIAAVLLGVGLCTVLVARRRPSPSGR